MLKIFKTLSNEQYYLQFQRDNTEYYCRLPGLTYREMTALPDGVWSQSYQISSNEPVFHTTAFPSKYLAQIITPIEMSAERYQHDVIFHESLLHAAAIAAQLCQSGYEGLAQLVSDLHESMAFIFQCEQWNQSLVTYVTQQKQQYLEQLVNNIQEQQLNAYFPHIKIDYAATWMLISSIISEEKIYSKYESIATRLTSDTILGGLFAELAGNNPVPFERLVLATVDKLCSEETNTPNQLDIQLLPLLNEMALYKIGRAYYKYLLEALCQKVYAKFTHLDLWIYEQSTLANLVNWPISYTLKHILRLAISGDYKQFFKITELSDEELQQLTPNYFMKIILIFIYFNLKNHYKNHKEFVSKAQGLLNNLLRDLYCLTDQKRIMLYAVLFIQALMKPELEKETRENLNNLMLMEMNSFEQNSFVVDELPVGFKCNFACYFIYLASSQDEPFNLQGLLNTPLHINDNTIVNPILFLAFLNKNDKLQKMLHFLMVDDFCSRKFEASKALILFYMILKIFPLGGAPNWAISFFKEHRQTLIDLLETEVLIEDMSDVSNYIIPMEGVAKLFRLKSNIDKMSHEVTQKILQYCFYQDCQDNDIEGILHYLYSGCLSPNINFFTEILRHDKFIKYFNENLKANFLKKYGDQTIFDPIQMTDFVIKASKQPTLAGCIDLLKSIGLYYDDMNSINKNGNKLFIVISGCLNILSCMKASVKIEKYEASFFNEIRDDLIDFLRLFNRYLKLGLDECKIINDLAMTQYYPQSSTADKLLDVKSIKNKKLFATEKVLLRLSQYPELLVKNEQPENPSINKSGMFFFLHCLQLTSIKKLDIIISALKKMKIFEKQLPEAIKYFFEMPNENLAIFTVNERTHCANKLLSCREETPIEHNNKRVADRSDDIMLGTKYRMFAPSVILPPERVRLPCVLENNQVLYK